jgi:hypothetical protein
MSHYPVSQELFQALLDHYWRARDNSVPRSCEQYPKGYCISYKALIEAAKVPLNPRAAVGPLSEIAAYCWFMYKVPLHALVVSAETGYPGGELEGFSKGYWSAAGSSKDIVGWAAVDVRKCHEAEGLPRVAPRLQ